MNAKQGFSTVQRQRKPRQNNLLSGSLKYNGSRNQATTLVLTSYDAQTCETRAVSDLESLTFEKGKVHWLHVSGLADEQTISRLCERIGLSLPIVQDILNARHIAKIEETEGWIFAVLDAYDQNNKRLDREHQSLLLSENIVVLFDEGAGHRFDSVRHALEKRIGRVQLHGADFLFNLLISMVVDSFFNVVELQQDTLLDLEDLLIEPKPAQPDMGRRIQAVRKDHTRLKKAVSPFREAFGRLMMMEPEHIADETRIYFRDTYDHLQQVMSMLESNREMLDSLMDLYLANNDLRLNTIVKQLTVVSTIFIPLTFLVGVWGMNFPHMPEFALENGYLFAWLAMLGIGVGLYFWFRRKNLL